MGSFLQKFFKRGAHNHGPLVKCICCYKASSGKMHHYRCQEDTEDPSELIAKAIHEVWRKNSGLETCIKLVTEDTDWVLKNGSKCDIQTTAYEDLPSDWKCKSVSLAKTVIEIVSKTHNTVTASKQLYDVWYASGCSKVKKVAFEELSHEQQESFISIIRLAMSFML
ncbi:hypothetical protein LPJ53_000470 [Coemansia erecta]|uniref:Uncharacterized protein n=1 Tax=Coemansia erecta TaxID=147472 RepID=A0A9W8CVL2_9FUNG|nr:hypothetical protein LPJ53_000470 [Coemansia erecta]